MLEWNRSQKLPCTSSCYHLMAIKVANNVYTVKIRKTQ